MIINLLKGVLIGLALVVPGLSGSAFAIVTGIYDKLIFAVNNIRKEFKKSFLFLLPIGLGAGIGILASTGAVVHLLRYFPLESYAFFIGLVLGSIPTIYSKIKTDKKSNSNYVIAGLSFVLIAALTFVMPADDVVRIVAIEGGGDFISILTAGIISCFLLAVPGVSGSLMLMLLGEFGTVYNAVSNFANVLLMLIRGQEGAMELGVSSGAIVLTFMVGSFIGIIAAAKIIGFLLERYAAKVYFAILGLVLGAIVTLAERGIVGFTQAEHTGYGFLFIHIPLVAVFIAAGFICTKFMTKEKIGAKK